ncbi:MAG: heme exporter protein CcmD [Porticoccaceae bacterium]|jgi:heme exporter protein D
MMFQFDSFAAFIAMGGHGPYVWMSYAITALILAWLVISPLLRARQLRAALRRQGRRSGVRDPAAGTHASSGQESNR